MIFRAYVVRIYLRGLRRQHISGVVPTKAAESSHGLKGTASAIPCIFSCTTQWIEAVQRKPAASPAGADAADMPPEYWEVILSGPRADARPSGKPLEHRKLSEVSLYVLR
jgi:hypothetical protein